MQATVAKRKEQEAAVHSIAASRESINDSKDHFPPHNEFNDILDKICEETNMQTTNLRMRCGEHRARPGSYTRLSYRQVQIANRKMYPKMMQRRRRGSLDGPFPTYQMRHPV